MGVPDSEEATVGLLTLHILDGELPVFFWGQGYGGSQVAPASVPSSSPRVAADPDG